MQAIILAAGMGKRLKDLTADNTKCMVKVNGVTLIERMLTQLDNRNLRRIILVVGYEGKKLIDYIETLPIHTPIDFITNSIYDKTNNIYSLALAKDRLCEDDTLLLESDLIFEDSVLDALMDDPRPTLALVDKYESWMDGTVVKLDDDDSIREFVPGKKFKFEDIPYYYKTVNIYKFSKHFSETHYVPFLDAYSKALGNNEYYEQVLRVITMLDEPEIKGKRLNGQLWYEIDDIQDLDIASSMFAPTDEEKLNRLQMRYGGYWRYPKLLDFCYLVNPYFPSQKLMDEMKSNFEKLLTQYPSGAAVNALLAAKNFSIHPEHIAVGNGAAELIKAVMENCQGKIGFIRPTFEEYPNRYAAKKSITFISQNEDYSYTANDIITFFSDTNLEMLVVINPDNPSGNYIPKCDLLRLCDWAKEKKIQLLVDESFCDFSDEEDNTLIDEYILNSYNNLIVIKSISKSYGVPGIRLGIIACGNEELIERIKKSVSIWNINSFGEFYLQIAEKYQKEYKVALRQFRKERQRFISELKKIEQLRVLPTQANYIMAEILEGYSSKELARILLVHYDIFIKDLSKKVNNKDRQFIRISIRNTEDNNKFLSAIKESFKGR